MHADVLSRQLDFAILTPLPQSSHSLSSGLPNAEDTVAYNSF